MKKIIILSIIAALSDNNCAMELSGDIIESLESAKEKKTITISVSDKPHEKIKKSLKHKRYSLPLSSNAIYNLEKLYQLKGSIDCKTIPDYEFLQNKFFDALDDFLACSDIAAVYAYIEETLEEILLLEKCKRELNPAAYEISERLQKSCTKVRLARTLLSSNVKIEILRTHNAPNEKTLTWQKFLKNTYTQPQIFSPIENPKLAQKKNKNIKAKFSKKSQSICFFLLSVSK